ncbi:hypothetical protein ACN4EE_19545 [Geminocystis sp. CENA526]|uniref:hypothetical protein n=1 Tax=Geminocystis sp. CENA526 TaxID=1355871 RepID=UPI003D702099
MKRIFIETRNKSVDYDWFNGENSKLESPNIPDLLEKLADTEFESLVLYRQSNELILAITALKSDRIDNRTRPIRNSLIWIADNNDDDAKIRAIIYEYLTAKDELEKEIAKAITETPAIKIDYPKIKAIGNQNNSEIKQNSSQPDLDNKIGSFNSDKCKEELINEITSYSLPKKDGLLIFITDSKSKENITKENPWRGLSSKISGGEWIILEKKSQSSTSSKNYSTNNNSNGLFINGLSIVLAIVLIVSNVFWFYQYNDLNKQYDSLKNQFEPSKIQIEKLETELLEVKNQLQAIKTAKEEFDKAFPNP